MKTGFACVLSFIFGAAAGAYLMHRYECSGWEEIEAADDISEEPKETDEKDKNTVSDIIASNDYDSEERTDYTNSYIQKENKDDTEVEEDGEEDDSKPYLITSDAYGETGYICLGYDYYDDDEVTDEKGYVLTVDEIEKYVGFENLRMFDNDETVRVYVRNDTLLLDIELVRVGETMEE